MKTDDRFVYFAHAEAAPFEPKQKGDEFWSGDEAWRRYTSDYENAHAKWFHKDAPSVHRRYPEGYHYRRPLSLLTDEQRAHVFGKSEFSPF